MFIIISLLNVNQIPDYKGKRQSHTEQHAKTRQNKPQVFQGLQQLIKSSGAESKDGSGAIEGKCINNFILKILLKFFRPI